MFCFRSYARASNTVSAPTITVRSSEISQAIQENDLSVVSVLSGNRNFEGRINPDVKMNYLASPPLVVAYAIAGTMDIDLANEPLGFDADGNGVHGLNERIRVKSFYEGHRFLDRLVRALARRWGWRTEDIVR